MTILTTTTHIGDSLSAILTGSDINSVSIGIAVRLDIQSGLLIQGTH